MKVLLLEPNEYWQQQFMEHLSDNFEIIPASDSATAQQLLARAAPDFVVGELMLADGPSYQFLEELRRENSNSSLPIVIFSQEKSLSDLEATLALGVSGYFIKGQDTVSDIHKLLLTLTSI